MSMREWAEREIELLKEANKPDEGECFDYIGGCCDSALKAYNTLLDDEHSGISIGITRNILNSLIKGRPLTPIEDVPEVWNYIGAFNEEEEAAGIKRYQCKRMSSLFKKEYPDGTVSYSDVDRGCGVNINCPSYRYHSGAIDNIIKERFPIDMPYCPTNEPYEVYTEDFLYDEDNGDYDTVAYYYILTPEGEKIELNKFYHYPGDATLEITQEQFEEMKKNRKDKPFFESDDE